MAFFGKQDRFLSRKSFGSHVGAKEVSKMLVLHEFLNLCASSQDLLQSRSFADLTCKHTIYQRGDRHLHTARSLHCPTVPSYFFPLRVCISLSGQQRNRNSRKWVYRNGKKFKDRLRETALYVSPQDHATYPSIFLTYLYVPRIQVPKLVEIREIFRPGTLQICQKVKG